MSNPSHTAKTISFVSFHDFQQDHRPTHKKQRKQKVGQCQNDPHGFFHDLDHCMTKSWDEVIKMYIKSLYWRKLCPMKHMFLLFAWMVQQCYDSWFNDDNWKIQDLKWAKRQIKVVLNGSIKGAIQPPTALDQ